MQLLVDLTIWELCIMEMNIAQPQGYDTIFIRSTKTTAWNLKKRRSFLKRTLFIYQVPYSINNFIVITCSGFSYALCNQTSKISHVPRAFLSNFRLLHQMMAVFFIDLLKFLVIFFPFSDIVLLFCFIFRGWREEHSVKKYWFGIQMIFS